MKKMEREIAVNRKSILNKTFESWNCMTNWKKYTHSASELERRGKDIVMMKSEREERDKDFKK